MLYAMQYTTPLAWRVVATLPARLVPADLAMLRANVTHVHWQHEFTKETVSLARSMQFQGGGEEEHDPVLAALAANLAHDKLLRGRQYAILYLALVHQGSAVGSDELMEALVTSGAAAPETATVQSVLAFDRLRRDPPQEHILEAVRRIIHMSIRYDMSHRYTVCANDLLWHLPSYSRNGGMREAVLLFLGHYHRRWIRAFTDCADFGGPDKIERAHTLVRSDVGMFAASLKQIPSARLARSLLALVPDYLARVRAIFPDDSEDDLAYKAMALMYRRPIQVWRVFAWPCSPREAGAMRAQMELGSLTVSPQEAVALGRSLAS